MNPKTCFFIGHRDAPETIRNKIAEAIEQCIIDYGVAQFFVGQYGRFDRMVARQLIEMKKCYPQITLFLLLPYHPAERPVTAPLGFDGTYYPEGMQGVPHRLAIVRANRYLVDHSDCLIAYVCHPASNARELLDYAKKREYRDLIKIILV